MAKKQASSNRGGRPAAGRAGQRRTDYPHQIAARVHGETYHLLAAIGAITGLSNAAAIESAIPTYLATLSRETRQAIEAAARAAQQHCPDCTPDK